MPPFHRVFRFLPWSFMVSWCNNVLTGMIILARVMLIRIDITLGPVWMSASMTNRSHHPALHYGPESDDSDDDDDDDDYDSNPGSGRLRQQSDGGSDDTGDIPSRTHSEIDHSDTESRGHEINLFSDDSDSDIEIVYHPIRSGTDFFSRFGGNSDSTQPDQ